MEAGGIGILENEGGRGSGKAGRNTEHIWRGGNLPRVLSLFSFFFYEEHFVQPHFTTFSTS